MKQLIKSIFVVVLAMIMALSSLVVTAAENTVLSHESSQTAISERAAVTREFELVWKFKKENGHYYKRRWNATLGEWYDPAWILIY